MTRQDAHIEPMGLSYSRTTLFDECPTAYRFRYIQRPPTTPAAPLEHGVVVHRALELLVRGAVADGRRGQLDAEDARAALRTAWAMEKAVGAGAYVTAREIVERFVETETDFDANRVLGIECAFSIPFGPFTLNGVMDRVDRIDDETIEIIDYKSGVVIPGADEVSDHLQLSLYQYAAREVWPWAKKVRLTLHMVRHGIKLRTTRTDENINDAVDYLQAVGHRIQDATAEDKFAPRLTSRCGGCLFRLSCPAYLSVVDSPVGDAGMPSALDAVAAERERLRIVVKAADARQRELDAVLRDAVDKSGELHAGGHLYTVRNTARRAYPLHATAEAVADAAGLSAADVTQRIGCVQNGTLTSVLKELDKQLPEQAALMLRANVEAMAERSYAAQLWSKPVKKSAEVVTHG